MGKITESEANELFRKWVKILLLNDWCIVFKWKVRKDQMTDPNCLGVTSYNHTSKEAIIEMLDEDDHLNTMFDYNYEKTLIHELLHLKFSNIDDTGDAMQEKMIHQLIDDLSKSFIAAKS